MTLPNQRGLSHLSWLGVLLAGGLHIAFFRGQPLDGPMLAALVLAFVVAAIALATMILALQRHAGDPAWGFFQVVPGWGRLLLGVGFFVVAANVVDWMPIAGPSRAGALGPGAFERAFAAIVAWQTLAAALYHTFHPREEAP